MKLVDYFLHKLRLLQKTRLWLILLLSFVVRIGFVLILNPDGFYLGDTRHFDSAARLLLAGEGFGEKYSRSPLYPVFIAAIYWLFGHSFLAVRVVEALLSVLLVRLIYLIARKAFNDNIAVLAAMLAAFFPHFIILTGLLYSTNLFTMFLASSLFFMLKSENDKTHRSLVLSSLCAGLATLTIPCMFFILPLWLLWLVLSRRRSLKFNLVKMSLFSLIIIALLTPWTIRNYHKYGRLTLVRPLTHTSFPNLANLDAQRERIKNGFAETTDYLKKYPRGSEADKISRILGNYVKHPIHAGQYMLGELKHFWALYPDRLDTPSFAYQAKVSAEDTRYVSVPNGLWKMVPIVSIFIMAPVFLFAVIGVVTSYPWDREKILLLLTIIGMSCGYSLVYAEVRYRIPIEPYVLMFTAAGLVRCCGLSQYAKKTES